MSNNTTTTDEVPVRKGVRWLVWYTAVHAYALTPRGCRERAILSRPDVQEALRASFAEIEKWKRSL